MASRFIPRRKRSTVGLMMRRKPFVGRAMKLKLGASKRSTPITIFGGPSLVPALL